MLRTFRVENYKSIDALEIELGRFNVFIGENGCGKSNLLEAIVIAQLTLSPTSEALTLRGVRHTTPELMACRLTDEPNGTTKIQCSTTNGTWDDSFSWADGPSAATGTIGALLKGLLERHRANPSDQPPTLAQVPVEQHHALMKDLSRFYENLSVRAVSDIRIYAPENSALRSYQTETQLRPLGIRGEGLFAHLNDLSKRPDGPALIDDIASGLTMLDWFDKLEVPKDLAVGEQRIAIFDRYLAKGALFDQRSANEGFLYLLFYFTLFTSPEVPPVFAIDNIDTSLNPLLCARLVKDLVDRAKKHEKQAFVTTHNPKILDGLDLTDDEQRLFVVERTKDGATRARRVSPPKPVGNKPPVALSEAFVRGYLGGVPKNF